MAEQTENRIKNIVGPEQIMPDTRLVLANAVYFNAAWLIPFSAQETKDGPFTTLAGDEVTVPLMHGTVRVPYMEGDGYQAVQLPYTNSSVDMLVILPHADRFANVEQQINADFIDTIRNRGEAYDVTLTMPRWEFESDLNLVELLMSMGMKQPFSSAANFSGIGDGGLFISDAVHRGTITVDEEGTEAAAATAVLMESSAYPTEEMALDRPFIFAIVERDTGTILFVGRVTNPA